MQSYKDNYCVTDENSILKLALLSVIGDREDQQDSAGFELKGNEGVICVCDGMGGHEGGKTASTLAVDTISRAYTEEYPCTDFHGFLVDSAVLADQKISTLKKEDGTPLQCGSTLVAVAIREKELYWLSVGDSRIYLHRAGEFVQVTNDHIYRYLLDQKKNTGQMTEDEYQKELVNGEALVSFLGIGGLPYIDSNDKPFPLFSGDKVLLMSDGLYKILPDNEIASIINNFTNIEDALHALEYKVSKAAQSKHIIRDNMTAFLIQIK